MTGRDAVLATLIALAVLVVAVVLLLAIGALLSPDGMEPAPERVLHRPGAS